MQMETCMRVTGLMTRQMVLGFTHIWMERGTRVTGKRINSMAKDKKHGQMGHFMMEIM